MSLIAAVSFGVASAVVYGTSIVVQHRTAQSSAGADGEASAAGLLQLIRSPIWWLAMGGDAIGFALQIIALSLGSVVVVQPLVVLMLPVSLLVSYLMGGPRPQVSDYLGGFGILAGLGVFLALIGQPHAARVPHSREIAFAVVVVLVIGALLTLAVQGRHRVIRGTVFGAVAGLYFGSLAVMVDAGSEQFSRGGLHALLMTPRGIVPIAGVVLLGLGGIILTQLSFQVGALGATLPANLAADPMTGVLLGAILLREHIPYSAGHLVAYTLCVAAVVAGAIRLANPARRPEGPQGPQGPDGSPGPEDDREQQQAAEARAATEG